MSRTCTLLQVALLAIIFTANATASFVANTSFEDEHDDLMPNGLSTVNSSYWGMPDDWAWRNAGQTNGHGIHQDEPPIGWSSDGDWSLYVYAAAYEHHTPGDFLEFYQTVDLSGVDVLSFDANLWGGAHTNSYVAIDTQKLWVENEANLFFDVILDVGGLSGTHELAFGVEVFESFGPVADGWTYFDNIVPEPATLSLLAFTGLLLTRRQRGPGLSS